MFEEDIDGEIYLHAVNKLSEIDDENDGAVVGVYKLERIHTFEVKRELK